MKKCIYLFALIAIISMASCSDSEDINRNTYTASIYNRAVDDNDVVFSQNVVQFQINSTESSIQISSEFKDMYGSSSMLNTPEMKLSAVAANVYSFASNSITGSTDITNFEGRIDLNTGMIWYSFKVNGSTTVYCTTHPIIFPYCSTLITDENGQSYTNEKSAYLFAIDSKGENGIMEITNFVSSTNGSVSVSVIDYSGITVTPTTTGYTLTADEAKSNVSEHYTITDLNITIDRQGQHMSGTFKCNDNNYIVNGDTWVIP